MLRLKPVLQIQGEKLDAFAKARTTSQGRSIMQNAILNDIEKRFGGKDAGNYYLQIAHTQNLEAALSLKEELAAQYPGIEIACHIGPGSLAIACCQKLDYDRAIGT